MQQSYLENPVMETGVCHVEMGEENLHKLFLWKQFTKTFSLTLLISVAFSVLVSKNTRRASTLMIFKTLCIQWFGDVLQSKRRNYLFFKCDVEPR